MSCIGAWKKTKLKPLENLSQNQNEVLDIFTRQDGTYLDDPQ